MTPADVAALLKSDLDPARMVMVMVVAGPGAAAAVRDAKLDGEVKVSPKPATKPATKPAK